MQNLTLCIPWHERGNSIRKAIQGHQKRFRLTSANISNSFTAKAKASWYCIRRNRISSFLIYPFFVFDSNPFEAWGDANLATSSTLHNLFLFEIFENLLNWHVQLHPLQLFLRLPCYGDNDSRHPAQVSFKTSIHRHSRCIACFNTPQCTGWN